MERILFRFTKGEPIKYVGHLDLMRVLERAMRRSGFPVAYSQGFNPRPRMAFASALTLGATSECELCQLDLATDIDASTLGTELEQLQKQLPVGMSILERWPLLVEKRNPYIQVLSATYELTLRGENAAARVSEFLQDGSGLPQAPLIEQRSGSSLDELMLTIELPVGERGGVRIRDLIAEIEAALPGLRGERLHRARLTCEQSPAIGDSPPEAVRLEPLP